MIVLEAPLRSLIEEIDLVATPSGDRKSTRLNSSH